MNKTATSFLMFMTYFIPFPVLCLPYFRQRKIKCGALSHSTFGPDSTAMAADNALNIRKSDTGAFKFPLAVETLEYAEEFMHKFHIEPYSIVRDGTSDFISIISASNLDFSFWTGTCELDCIGDE